MEKSKIEKKDTDHKVDAVSNEKEEVILVSMFKNCKSTEAVTVELKSVYRAIREGKYKNQVDEIRYLSAEGLYEKADDLKRNILPAVIFSGVFSNGRSVESLNHYNQLICLDFDYIDDDYFASLFGLVKNIGYTYMAFKSPKGIGLKVLVKVDSTKEMHRNAFNQVRKYYEEQLGISADSTPDVNRLCILSEDNGAYFDQDSIAFNVTPMPIEKAIKIEEKLFNGGMGLQARFEKVVDFTNNSKQFFKGNRNNYVFILTMNCLRRGFSEDETMELILNSEFSHDKRSDIATIKGAYRNNMSQFNMYPLFKNYHDKEDRGTKPGKMNVASVASVAQPKYATIKAFYDLAQEGKLLKPKRKLFGNYILENSTTLFPSERGIGKSFLVMQLAICIARGDSGYLGEEIELNGNVLYINLELDNDTVATRMKDLLADEEWQSKYNPHCLTSRQGLKIIYNDILEYCSKNEPVLIIIDNLRTAFSGTDNEKNSQMTEMITLINSLKDQTKTAITIVHHTKKGTSNQITHSDMQSGAGALTDLVDADFFLRRSYVDKDLRILKRVKARNCEEQDGAKLIALNTETLWFELRADGVDEAEHVIYESAERQRGENHKKIIQLINNGLGDAEISKEVGYNRSSIFRIRKKISQN